MGMHQKFPHGRSLNRKSGGGDNGDDNNQDNLEMKGLIDALNQRDQEIKTFCENAQKEIKETGKIADDTKGALELLAKSGSEMQERLTALEQKGARRGKPEARTKTWGHSVVETDSFKSMAEGRVGRTGRIDVKAITSAPDSAADMVVTERLPGIVAQPDRVATIRDLIMPGRTTSNAIEYVRETGFTNNAAPQVEGELKAQSDMAFELATANVRTIAHWIPATKQILDDAPQLASYIDGRLRYGLTYVEEEQLLLGDGTGQNILGLIPQATSYNTGLNKAGDTRIDAIRHAILQVRLAEYRASGIVLHPTDWERIELTKTDDNAYVFANPTAQTQPRLWGLPVVETTAMPEGQMMVGAFNMAAQIFDRETTTVEVSTEDRDNFVRNMVTVRAEERLAMCVYRPESFVVGSFPDTSAGA
ncbi:phage major capsid protein [uncultured Kushneria sp.]|uniref:phage major capsid protein n=1 Tax=uncultured Kushneria sp. TaxID=905033 RepID=UPI0026343B1C|nr:phage major capsid protein [uncultured Kushneria sp.]